MAYIKVEIEVNVTDQDIDDIMATALEGGINYWCDKANVVGAYLGTYASDQISRGGMLELYLDEEYNDTDMFVLDREKFISGLKLYLADGCCKITEMETGDFGMTTGKLVLDCCQIDSVIADSIVQLALFGEIVFC